MMDTAETRDFTDLTCTNPMIKLKILLNRLPPGDSVAFYDTREQLDNTCHPFCDHGYQVDWKEATENRYLVQIGRKGGEQALLAAYQIIQILLISII